MTREEYNRCVRQYADNVYRFVLKNIRHEADAEDIVQNSFEILWKKHDEVNFEKAKSYLFMVARNNMIDQIRKRKRAGITDDESKADRMVKNEYTGAAEALDYALKLLPEKQREVILLRDYEGYSYQEIGEITGLSESQVKVYIFRARRALQKILVNPENVL